MPPEWFEMDRCGHILYNRSLDGLGGDFRSFQPGVDAGSLRIGGGEMEVRVPLRVLEKMTFKLCTDGCFICNFKNAFIRIYAGRHLHHIY